MSEDKPQYEVTFGVAWEKLDDEAKQTLFPVWDDTLPIDYNKISPENAHKGIPDAEHMVKKISIFSIFFLN